MIVPLSYDEEFLEAFLEFLDPILYFVELTT